MCASVVRACSKMRNESHSFSKPMIFFHSEWMNLYGDKTCCKFPLAVVRVSVVRDLRVTFVLDWKFLFPNVATVGWLIVSFSSQIHRLLFAIRLVCKSKMMGSLGLLKRAKKPI